MNCNLPSLLSFFRLLAVIILASCGSSSSDTADEDISQYSIVIHESAHPDANLHITNTNGSKYFTLADSVDAEYFYGQGPDGRLYYQRDVGNLNQFNLYSINVLGEDRRALAESVNAEYFVGWSTDRRVVYLEKQPVVVPPGTIPPPGYLYDIYSVLPDGTGRTKLISSLNSNFGPLTPYVLSDNNILYHIDNSGQLDIHVIRADGTNPIVLANSTDNEILETASNGRVIYHRQPATAGSTYDIYSVKLDGTGITPLAVDAEHEAVRHITDSGWVVFERGPIGSAQLHSVTVDGASTALLSDRAGNSSFYAASGDRIIFSHYDPSATDPQSDIYAIDIDGTDEVALANTADSEGFETIAPNGRVIYTQVVSVTAFTGHRDLYSVLPDGSGKVAIATGQYQDNFVTATKENNIISFEASVDPPISRFNIMPSDGSSAAVPLSPETGRAFYCGIASDGRVVLSYSPSVNPVDVEIYAINQDGTNKTYLTDHPGIYGCNVFTPDGKIVIRETVIVDGKAEEYHYIASSRGDAPVPLHRYSSQDGIYDKIVDHSLIN